jgi:hypothetical protein
MKYQFYSVQLRCGHYFPVGEFENKPSAEDIRYCPVCKKDCRIIAVYNNSREIDDIEEMME